MKIPGLQVKDGWTEPVAKGDGGKMVSKQKKLWTDDEKEASKMNSRVISAIINTLYDDHFK